MSAEASLPALLVEKTTGLHVPDTLVMGGLLVAGSAVAFPMLRRRFSLDSPGRAQQLLEGVVGFLRGLLDQTTGRMGYQYIPYLGTLFLYIALCNISGLIPGLSAPTGNSWGFPLSLAIVSFFYYHVQSIKVIGSLTWGHHFLGPVPIRGLPLIMSVLLNPFLALIFLSVEVISHSARILTLSARLFLNMSVEHSLSSGMAAVMPFGLPAVLMFLGIFVCLLQAFIFTFLTMVYISLFVSHGGHEEHGQPGHAH
jgi:F-type H+-transporting ATPase subunit a